MESRWYDRDASAAIDRWGERYGRDLALRAYSSQLIGVEPDLVLHGGGNTSLKALTKNIFDEEIPALFIKGSGIDLATIQPDGFAALDLDPLKRLRNLCALSEADMSNQLWLHRLNPAAPSPSVETLLHVFLPHRFIDHSHADALLCLSNQPEGETLLREAVGDAVTILPYIMPGFPLAMQVALAFEKRPNVTGIIVAHHGLFTFYDDARTAYENHIAIVSACERFLKARRPKCLLTPAYRTEESAGRLAARIAPVLRGLLAKPSGDPDAPHRRLLLDWRADEEVLSFVNSQEAAALSVAGPLTPDHVTRTKPFALFVAGPLPEVSEGLRAHLKQAVTDYVARYEAYVSRHTASKSLGGSRLDPLPRVVLIPGAGAFCFGRTKREAVVAADITVHTLRIKALAHAMGGYKPASDEHVCELEYWNLQQAKLGSEADHLLDGQVVLVTGGAGAIGYGIVKTCMEAGAHVVLTDVDSVRLEHVTQRLEAAHGRGKARGVVMDVTDEASVQAGFAEACRHYGGVDVIVPNAGIAHVAQVADLKTADLERVMAVNFLGTFLTIREGVRVLRAQGLGGNIVINASKNVFGPGKDFGAYSSSKAAGHQLGKVAAIELAAEEIRVNMINADAIFSEDEVASGLWATVGPERAKSRGLKLDELPDYYRSRNLLRARVTARHVGNAVVFFACNRTPTTGATLPVDGGVVEAFPR